MKEGYKLTELGEIPEDWEVSSLSEKTSKIGSGITPTGGEKVYKTNGHVFIRSQNVGWGTLLLEDVAFIDDTTHQQFNSTEIKNHDVFLNITGASIGRSALADERVEKGNVNQHVCIIRTKQSQLHPKYLNYFLLSSKGQKQIDSFQAGGNRQGLNFGQIKSFKLILPLIKEQLFIAKALSETDALIQSLEKLIAKKQNIKQGTTHILLTGKKRLEGFNEKWQTKNLNQIADLIKGKGLSKTKIIDGGELACLLYGELFTTYCRVIRKVTSFTNSNEGLVSKYGDILMPGSTTTKGIDLAVASALLVRNVRLGGDVNVIRQKNERDYNPEFLAYYLTTVKKDTIAEATQGTTIIHLYGRNLKNILLELPSLREQEEIIKVLNDMDNEISSLQTKLHKLRLVKQGMMQSLLTGKIRLL